MFCIRIARNGFCVREWTRGCAGCGTYLCVGLGPGSAAFGGVTSAADVQVTALTVLGYTAIHFAGFIIVGLVFAALVLRAEESPPLLMGLALLFVTFETLLLGLVAIVAAWLLDALAWWSIGVGNLLAAAVMAVYLWRSHPKLRGEVRRADDESLEAHADQGSP